MWYKRFLNLVVIVAILCSDTLVHLEIVFSILPL